MQGPEQKWPEKIYDGVVVCRSIVIICLTLHPRKIEKFTSFPQSQPQSP
jgi:hypothetical protein